MINEENLKKIYEGIIESPELTTKMLNSYGLSGKDLKDLIKMGKLERVKRGFYTLKDGKSLFDYGCALLEQNEDEKAFLLFEQCHLIDSKYSGYCLQFFLEAITKKQYDVAVKCFKIFKLKEAYYLSDYNLWLYLLSYLTELDDKYKHYVKCYKRHDFKLNYFDERYEEIETRNKIRFAIISGKHGKAKMELQRLMTQDSASYLMDEILIEILNQVRDKETETKKILLDFYQEKNYQQMLNLLEKQESLHRLSSRDFYTMKLLKTILSLRDGLPFPTATVFSSDKVIEAIDGHNYELAFQLSDEYLKNQPIETSANFINFLLRDICEIKKERKIQEELNSICFIENISSYFRRDDFISMISCLDDFIIRGEKYDYEFVLKSALKWCILQGDINFSFLKAIILQIGEQNSSFEINSFISQFQELVRQNRFFEARIYLEMMQSINNFNSKKINIEFYATCLNEAEQKYQDRIALMNSLKEIEKNENEQIIKAPVVEVLRKTDIEVEVLEEQVLGVSEVEKNEIAPNNHLEKNRVIVEEEENESIVFTNQELDVVEKYHQTLMHQQDVIILQTMLDEKCERLEAILKRYSDVRYFYIGQGKKKRLVLKYNPPLKERINFTEIIKLGNAFYDEGNYKKSIECFKKLLYYGNDNILNYVKLGIAYAKLKENAKAIDFLTIAHELSQQKDGRYDFIDLINALRGIKNEKPYFKMFLEEFENDVSSTYGFQNLDKITNYILDSGLDVRSAAQELDFNQNDIDDLCLLYAKQYFAQGDYEKGNQFLYSVEKRKGKSDFTKQLLREIRKNKRFYIYRKDAEGPRLSLNLKV